MGATPEQVHDRKARYEAHWPEMDCTPEALVKHWELMATAAPSGQQPVDQQYEQARMEFLNLDGFVQQDWKGHTHCHWDDRPAVEAWAKAGKPNGPPPKQGEHP